MFKLYQTLSLGIVKIGKCIDIGLLLSSESEST